jgi:hypothetical protein
MNAGTEKASRTSSSGTRRCHGPGRCGEPPRSQTRLRVPTAMSRACPTQLEQQAGTALDP